MDEYIENDKDSARKKDGTSTSASAAAPEKPEKPEQQQPPSPPEDEVCAINEKGVTNKKFEETFGLVLCGGGVGSSNVRRVCQKCNQSYPLRMFTKFHSHCNNP